jgi:hypothetical protein
MEDGHCLGGRVLSHKVSHSLVGRMRGGEGVVMSVSNDGSVACDSPCNVSSTSNMSDLPDYLSVSFNHSVESPHNIMGVGETVLLHNGE